VRRLLLLPLAALALLLAGCFQIAIDIEVNEDGSGTLGLTLAMERDFYESISDGEPFIDPDEDIDQASLPDGTTVEVIDTPDEVGVRIRLPFAAGGDVAAAIEQALAALGDDTEFLTGEDGFFEAFSLQRTGDDWALTARTAAPSLDQDDPDVAFAQFFLQDLNLRLRVLMPGEVLEHNADSVEADGSLVWEVPVLQGREISARSTLSSGGGGLSMPVIAAIVIGVLVLLGLGALAMSRRGAAAPATTTEVETPPPPPPPTP
jgi:hypothetical protein